MIFVVFVIGVVFLESSFFYWSFCSFSVSHSVSSFFTFTLNILQFIFCFLLTFSDFITTFFWRGLCICSSSSLTIIVAANFSLDLSAMADRWYSSSHCKDQMLQFEKKTVIWLNVVFNIFTLLFSTFSYWTHCLYWRCMWVDWLCYVSTAHSSNG